MAGYFFPNPTQGQMTIETSELTNKSKLSIFNLSVQELISVKITESTTQIDISSLPAGIYFVRFINGKAVVNSKIIKW